jgi:uncharacterized protein
MNDDCLPALRFEMDEDSGRLTAVFDPAGVHSGRLDRDGLIESLAAAGWSALHHYDDAAARFVDLAAGAEMVVRLPIAERRDGRCEIRVAADAMSANLTLYPPAGGRPVSREQIDQALQAAGVVSGCLDPVIAQALAAQAAEGLVVARGRPAAAGTPTRFISLLPAIQQRGPSVNERGIADYRELGTLVIVHAGDPLMRRVPAQPGLAGEDVLGLVVPAATGTDILFAAGISGAAPSDDDPDLLVAAIAGQPVLLPHGVTVHPTITVPAVDLSSGNIDFDGTVNVKGDVAPGMHVRATGDVFVTGAVEAAHIEAGGNITVAAGAIGLADGRGGQAAALKARLAAQGAVSVMFCENAVISAGTDLRIGEVALHCDLTADVQIVIGKPGARRSQLIGGAARASALLQVGVLGSTAGVHTRIEIGYHPQERAQFAALQAEVERSEAKLESLQQVLAYTETLTDARHQEIRERARITLEASEQSHVELLDRLADAQTHLVLSEDPRIIVGQFVHSGVDIRLGSKTLKTQDTAMGGVFHLVEGEIAFDGR